MDVEPIIGSAGYTRFPPVEGVGSGGVEVYESSDAGHIWLHATGPGDLVAPVEVSVQLTIKSADALRKQLTHLINKHRGRP